MPLFRMLFHYCARSHFFSASAIPAALLSTLFDVFVLTLFFCTDASEMFLTRHEKVLRAFVVQSFSQCAPAAPEDFPENAITTESAA